MTSVRTPQVTEEDRVGHQARVRPGEQGVCGHGDGRSRGERHAHAHHHYRTQDRATIADLTQSKLAAEQEQEHFQAELGDHREGALGVRREQPVLAVRPQAAEKGWAKKQTAKNLADHPGLAEPCEESSQQVTTHQDHGNRPQEAAELIRRADMPAGHDRDYAQGHRYQQEEACAYVPAVAEPAGRRGFGACGGHLVIRSFQKLVPARTNTAAGRTAGVRA